MALTTSTTGNDIIELAYARLRDISPEHIASEDSELVLFINRALAGLYAVAARINPAFYGTVVTVDFDETVEGWERPKAAETVFRIETVDGEEVVIVPFDQRDIEPYRPSLFALGQYYRSGTPAYSPVWGTLRFYYSRRPQTVQTLENTLDPLWPEAFNELLALEVAVYLAIKDGETEQVGHLKDERNQWLVRYIAFLQHETSGMVRAWSTVRRMPGEIMAMLAGNG